MCGTAQTAAEKGKEAYRDASDNTYQLVIGRSSIGICLGAYHQKTCVNAQIINQNKTKMERIKMPA